MKVLFARIGYMQYYSGSQKGDKKPKHGGSYNIEGIGHEIYNFKKVRQHLYGYFQPYEPPKDSDKQVTVNLERIEPLASDADIVNNVLLIFVSTSDEYGQVIIGWYKDADVYREYQPSDKSLLREDYNFNLKAHIRNSVLLPQHYRKYTIPTGKGAFGRANVAYLYENNGTKRDLDGSKFQWIKNAIDYVENYDGPNLLVDTTGDAEKDIEDLIESHRTNQSGQGFKITPQLRKLIEEYSVKKAIKYFEKLKYSVKNVGGTKSYDLECSKNGDLLRVEVKGSQTNGESVILTPKEVRNAKNHKTALYVLHSIRVDMIRKRFKLSMGKGKIIKPWDINKQGKLKTLSYMYFLPDD